MSHIRSHRSKAQYLWNIVIRTHIRNISFHETVQTGVEKTLMCSVSVNELTHDLSDRTQVHAYFKDICFRVTITAALRNGSPEDVALCLNAHDVVTGVFSRCPRVLSFRECHILLNSPTGFSVMLHNADDTFL